MNLAEKEIETAPTIPQMNALAETIAVLRDEEKRLADLKKEVTEQLAVKEHEAMELILNNNLTSYRAPVGLLSIAMKTSVRLPQGEQAQEWLAYLEERYGSLKGAVENGMLSTNSMRLNSFYKEEFELAQERGESDFKIKGLTEIKVMPNLSFRRTR